MQKQLESILRREMDRKEFLKLTALGIASVAGISALSGILSPSKQIKSPSSYGGSVYGGVSTIKPKTQKLVQ